jgi:glycosyltransferase involved in cell wall biosynthesis
MFPLFKKRTKKTEIKVLDLTINSTLEDDYILPDDIKEKLLKRGIRANCTPLTAEKRIEEWEEEFSIKSIRENYIEHNWSNVVYLASNRVRIYFKREPFVYLIRSLYKLKQWAECVIACEKLLEIKQQSSIAIRFIARCAKQMGNYHLCSQNYSRLLTIDENDTDAMLALIRLNYNCKNMQDVIKYSKLLIEKNAEGSEGQRYLAKGLVATNNHRNAILVLSSLNKINPTDIEVLINLGKSNYKLGKYQDCKEWLEKALLINRNDQRIRRTLSLCYDKLRLWEDALQLYRDECHYAPMEFLNWEKLINLYCRLNREEEAKQCLDEIIEKLDDGLHRTILLYQICMSYRWSGKAEIILNELEKDWGNVPEFYFSIIRLNITAGNLTQIYKYLKMGRRICKRIPEYRSLKNEFEISLKPLNLSLRDVRRQLKNGNTILRSEAAIRNILKLCENIEVRKPKKDKPSIVIISSTMGRGGAERQVLNCLKGLKSIPKYDDVRLFCNVVDNTGGRIATYAPEIAEIGASIDEYSNTEMWENKFGKTSVDLGRLQDAFEHLPVKMQNAIKPLYVAFTKINPDIVHAWQDQTNINVAIAAKMAAIPGIVLFARSLRPDHKTMMHTRTRPYLRSAYKSILEDKNILLCHNSNAGAESYSQWLGTPVNRFSVIHNGIDFSGMEQNLNKEVVLEILRSKGIQKDSLVIGGVFRLVQEKRPKLWVDSVAKVIRVNKNSHAIIVGNGGMFEQISSYIDELGLTDRIHLVGQTRDVKSWLDEMDVFLLTSIVEGLPNVLIEAQAFGVPVITTDAGGARDTILEGLTGFVVESNPDSLSDRIVQCFNDKQWLNDAKRFAVENSTSKFSTETMITNLIGIYQKSIAKHK